MNEDLQKTYGDIFTLLEAEPRQAESAFIYNDIPISKDKSDDDEILQWTMEHVLSPIRGTIVSRMASVLNLGHMTNEEKIELGFRYNDISLWTGLIKRHIDFSTLTNNAIVTLGERIYEPCIEKYRQQLKQRGAEFPEHHPKLCIESHQERAWIALAEKMHWEDMELDAQIDFALNSCGNPAVIDYVLKEGDGLEGTSRIRSWPDDKRARLEEAMIIAFLKRYGFEPSGSLRENRYLLGESTAGQTVDWHFKK